MKRRFFILFGLSFASVALAGPTLQMRMEISPHEVYIGDLIQARITMTAGSDVTPIPLEPPKTLGNFEVRTWSPQPVKDEPNHQKTFQIDFELLTFSTGTQTIPSLALRFKSADGSISEAKTEEFPITVKSILQEKGDEGRLRPLKGLVNYRSWRWLVILLAILGVGGLLFWFWHARKKGKILGKPLGPVKKPEELAWESLHELEDSPWIAEGKIKEFYSRLSEILRTYIEGRYNLSALEKTTSELIIDLRSLGIASELQSSIRMFLDTGDLAKFAKFMPQEDEVRSDLLRVKEFVSKTTPVAAAPTATEVREKEEIPL